MRDGAHGHSVGELRRRAGDASVAEDAHFDVRALGSRLSDHLSAAHGLLRLGSHSLLGVRVCAAEVRLVNWGKTLELGGSALELRGDALELGGNALELRGDALELRGDASELGGHTLESRQSEVGCVGVASSSKICMGHLGRGHVGREV